MSENPPPKKFVASACLNDLVDRVKVVWGKPEDVAQFGINELQQHSAIIAVKVGVDEARDFEFQKEMRAEAERTAKLGPEAGPVAFAESYMDAFALTFFGKARFGKRACSLPESVNRG